MKAAAAVIDDSSQENDIAFFWRAVLGTQVLKALNLPETCSTVTASMFYDYLADPAAFGAPLPCTEIKLEDVPELGLVTTDDGRRNPRGELWVRGHNVFRGYWDDQTATRNVLDADGWFMTSILAEILPNGTLKVLGRK